MARAGKGDIAQAIDNQHHDDCHLVYDNDLGDPIADGFYFTIGYPKYEEYHRVKYTPEAIEACVNWSNLYINDRNHPDKDIDVVINVFDNCLFKLFIAVINFSIIYFLL